jgi:hypothetical protein
VDDVLHGHCNKSSRNHRHKLLRVMKFEPHLQGVVLRCISSQRGPGCTRAACCRTNLLGARLEAGPQIVRVKLL